MDIKILFDALRKINGKLTQKQVDTFNSLLTTVPINMLIDLLGIEELSANKKTSENGINIIKDFEGYMSKAYDDGVGVMTIGWGTTLYPDGTKVKKGDTCTKEQAEYYLKSDLKEFENTVNTVVTAALTQNQFDALVSLCYNIGSGAFSKSTLVKKLNGNKTQDAADQFLVWNKGGGKVMQGLVKRRARERELFLKGN